MNTVTTEKSAVKMTKADHFEAMLNFLSENPGIEFHNAKGKLTAEQMVKFATHEVELLDKKNSADKKPTIHQAANEGIKTAILNGMEEGKPYTITDIIKDEIIGVCADLTNQRVSALMRQLKEEGKVIRTEDKRKAYFTKA